jgi:A/G-specific adenine glycosylase
LFSEIKILKIPLMADFHLLTIDWYRQNMRDLPWRKTNNPYIIWLSEIILQQTRVDQGLNYFLKFQKHYPTVFDLAKADEQNVLNDWQGLGYYSRARNLHATAKRIVDEFEGVFPTDFKTLKTLKGVGDYTAAAIASFAYNLPHAVVDGNVYRVLSRVFNIDLAIDSGKGKKHFSELANELLPKNNPGEYNQSIMEFGALQCTPGSPNCQICPLESICLAKAENTISSRPVKAGKTKVRKRNLVYLIFEVGTKQIIEKRTAKDIWQHLYQFPLLEHPTDNSNELILSEIKQTFNLSPFKISEKITHILSHQKITARFFHFNQFPENLSENWEIINTQDLSNYPLPRLIDRYLENQIKEIPHID